MSGLHEHTPALQVGEARGYVVAVSSGHRLASEEAVSCFLNGGNVVDAAIAGAAVLGTVLPYACGIGGDAYLLYYDASLNKMHALNGTGAAPSGAIGERFPGRMPSTGILACTIPGALALWEDALARFGSISLSVALQSAIRYAQDGFPVHLGLIENIEEKRELLRQDAEAARLYLPDGGLETGRTFRQPDLARVLLQIAERGAREFYEGSLAREFVTGIAAAGGLFAETDMVAHRTLAQSPMQIPFYGHEVFTMPPNSVGLQLLLQLAALEAARIDRYDPGSIDFWRATVAAWRWSIETSEEAIGDPDASVEKAHRLLEASAKSLPALDRIGNRTALGEGADTSNLVIMDSKGNAVSLVQSVSAPFASGIVLPGMGILLNNRMRGFNTVEGSINCVAPGRRPKHTLVPAMVRRGERITMAIGTPGAAGQPLTLAQVLSRVLAIRQNMAEAILAPRWSVGLAGEIIVENHTPSVLVDALRAEEPDLAVKSMRHVRFGSVKAVSSDGRSLHAVADFRRVADVYAA